MINVQTLNWSIAGVNAEFFSFNVGRVYSIAGRKIDRKIYKGRSREREWWREEKTRYTYDWVFNKASFLMTGGVIMNSVLFSIYFSFWINLYLHYWDFFYFLKKNIILRVFSNICTYIRVVNFSSLKFDELKLFIFWPFRVQTSKSNICLKL